MSGPERAHALAFDAADPLGRQREAFALPDGVIYLDGNSLGALPKATPARLARVAAEEWGRDLVTSWNKHGWIDLPRRIGDKIARLIGAGPGEVVVADSTSVNLFKVLAAALRLNPGRTVILSERDNFPSDLPTALAPKPSQGSTATPSCSSKAPANCSALAPVPRMSSSTNMPPSGGVTLHLGAVARMPDSSAARRR